MHGHGYPGLRYEKSGLLERKRGTLMFQHYYTMNGCGALCTYNLYDKQSDATDSDVDLDAFTASDDHLDVGL